jgi:60 kDa SS-A/Ro ribonucleoprotein
VRKFHLHTSVKKTKQTKKVLGVKNQKVNSAGGISFGVTNWELLERFLIIGTEGGTFYANESKLTIENAKNVIACINEDGSRTVKTICEISIGGEASNNDAAIFALAMCCSAEEKITRIYAFSKLRDVCRISTHLFHFVEYIKSMRGYGRLVRENVSSWYTEKSDKDLAYQMLKYKNRDGWTHRDILRLSHPVPKSNAQREMFKFAVGKRTNIPPISKYAIGCGYIKTVDSAKDCVKLITDYNLTREVIPTNFLNDKSVWDALLQKMPMTAMIRNLGKMSNVGLHKPLSESVKLTVRKLKDNEAIKRSRIHPINILNAIYVYANGKGIKGSLNWVPEGAIVEALEYAFYRSFNNVEPTGKNIMLALDVSGSMAWHNLPRIVLTPRDVSALMAMVTMRVEENVFIKGFSTNLVNIPITRNSSIREAIDLTSRINFGSTNCAHPFMYCEKNGIDVDAIVVYTDSETYAGSMHPWQALDSLQNKLGHKVKCVVVGMESNDFSIARPDYDNMLDVVGFSTNTPNVISNFIKG